MIERRRLLDVQSELENATVLVLVAYLLFHVLTRLAAENAARGRVDSDCGQFAKCMIKL